MKLQPGCCLGGYALDQMIKVLSRAGFYRALINPAQTSFKLHLPQRHLILLRPEQRLRLLTGESFQLVGYGRPTKANDAANDLQRAARLRGLAAIVCAFQSENAVAYR